MKQIRIGRSMSEKADITKAEPKGLNALYRELRKKPLPTVDRVQLVGFGI